MCVCVHVCVLSLYFCPNCIVKMCCVLAMHLSRCVVFGQGALCVCVCVFFVICALNALSRCVVFRQCTCQDVLSFGNAPVRMCHLWAGSLVCVFFLFISALIALSRCVVYRQYTCQDVSSFGGGPCVHVCVFFLFICALNALFKLCRLSAMHLSRGVVFGQGPCVCVCVFFIICALNALSRCVVFRQCTCQDVSSFGNAPVKMCHLWVGGLVCVCACVCSFSLFLP